MEIFGKLNPSALHSGQFGTCQEVIEELFTACFHGITIVSIGKGYVSELDESLLTITTANVDDLTAKYLKEGLEKCFDGTFALVFTGEDPLIPKDGCWDVIGEVIDRRIVNRMAARQSEIDRAAYTEARANEPYEEPEGYRTQDEAYWYAD